MITLYWFALVVGAGMYLFSLFADVTGHGDVDAGGDVAHDGGLHGFQILSLRNATYFLFAFGVSGVTLSWMWGGRRGLLTAVIASLLGVTGAALAAGVFRWLQRSESGAMPGDAEWIGATGQVTLPLSATGTGKILVSRGRREHEFLARPFDEQAEAPERWTSVMVMEMRHGVALVAPNDAALDGGEAPLLDESRET